VAWCNGQHGSQPRPRLDEVAQGITVEHVDESKARPLQRALQHTAPLDRARSIDGIEARHERHVWLGMPHDLTEPDRLGGLCELQSATSAADRRDVPGDTELMSNLHEVVLGDTVAFGDLGNCRQPVPGDWGLHLATMRDFWSSVMLTSGRYKGNPVAVHLRIEGMVPRLFDRWLELFGETCGELFDDSLAEAFRAKALRIAESLKLALFYRPDRPWPRSVP
jgi:hemoglobin